MADNYLERKMEDYRRSSVTTRHSCSPTLYRQPKGTIAIPFEPKCIMIAGTGSDLDEKIIIQMRSAGCRVAFTCADIVRGRTLAQSTGAQHHPVDIHSPGALEKVILSATSKWGKIDTIIFTEPSDILPRILPHIPEEIKTIAVSSHAIPRLTHHLIIFNGEDQIHAGSVAAACRFLCEPANTIAEITLTF